MNIWEIQQNLIAIFDELEENGGELTEEIADVLEVTQDSFKNKIEQYTKVIKSINSDIAAIDAETKRLAEFKKSKQRVIERLNKIIIDAVTKFGDTTKSGGKFIDYGTGKVSVRNSIKCETDDDKLKCMADEYARIISYENMLKGASVRNNITFEEMIDKCKNHKDINMDIVSDAPQEITHSDIETASFEISVRVGMEDMLCSMGFNAVKTLADVFGVNVAVTPKIDKTMLKAYLTKNTEENVTIGKLVENKTISIK